MVKRMKESDRFLIGWGRAKDGRLAFFISHRKIQHGRTIPTDPKDLVKRLTKYATQIDGGKPKRK